MRVVVDADLCIGCGVCEEACPEAFRMDDSGIAVVVAEEFSPEQYGTVRDAADMCPTSAISAHE